LLWSKGEEMTYFIGDMHLGHSNIIRLCNRPFKNVDEMNSALIKNWNKRVKEDDDVYLLGDVAFRSQTDVVSILKTLKGKKHLLIGNHDKRNLKNPEFVKCFVSIKDMDTILVGGEGIVLCHYPLAEWDGYFRGTYHIYGHIHNNKNRSFDFLKEEPRALNAGADIINFTPATLEELIRYNEIFKKNSTI